MALSCTATLLNLPNEILAQIVGALDAVQDRRCLLDLMTVSSRFWELVARHLYAELSLDNERLSQVVATGKGVSSRTQRALTFTRRLRISPDGLTESTIQRLWEAAVPHEVLFPNVRQLIYDDRRPYDPGEWLDHFDIPQPPQPPADIVLLDNVDVCFTGHSGYPQLLRLPIRSLRTITCHAANCIGIFKWGFPSPWQVSFRVFDNTFNLERFQDRHERGQWKKFAVKNLKWKDGDPRPKIQMCWLSDKPVPSILEEMEKMDGFFEWRPSTTGFQFEVYPRDEPQQPHGKCRPCDVCGHTWLARDWKKGGWKKKGEWDL